MSGIISAIGKWLTGGTPARISWVISARSHEISEWRRPVNCLHVHYQLQDKSNPMRWALVSFHGSN